MLPGGLQPGGKPPSAGGDVVANATDLWLGCGQLCLPGLEGSQRQVPIPGPDGVLWLLHGVAMLPPEGVGGWHQGALPSDLSTVQSAQCELPAWDARYPWPNPHGAPFLPHSLHGPQQFPLTYPWNICLSQFYQYPSWFLSMQVNPAHSSRSRTLLTVRVSSFSPCGPQGQGPNPLHSLRTWPRSFR